MVEPLGRLGLLNMDMAHLPLDGQSKPLDIEKCSGIGLNYFTMERDHKTKSNSLGVILINRELSFQGTKQPYNWQSWATFLGSPLNVISQGICIPIAAPPSNPFVFLISKLAGSICPVYQQGTHQPILSQGRAFATDQPSLRPELRRHRRRKPPRPAKASYPLQVVPVS